MADARLTRNSGDNTFALSLLLGTAGFGCVVRPFRIVFRSVFATRRLFFTAGARAAVFFFRGRAFSTFFLSRFPAGFVLFLAVVFLAAAADRDFPALAFFVARALRTATLGVRLTAIRFFGLFLAFEDVLRGAGFFFLFLVAMLASSTQGVLQGLLSPYSKVTFGGATRSKRRFRTLPIPALPL
jgi:hypothetical protein